MEELFSRLARVKRFFFRKKGVTRTDLDPSERVLRETQAWGFCFRRFSSYRNSRHYTLKTSQLTLISSGMISQIYVVSMDTNCYTLFLLKSVPLLVFFLLTSTTYAHSENWVTLMKKMPPSPVTSRSPEHRLHSSRCHSGSVRARARVCVRVCVHTPMCCLQSCFSKGQLYEAFKFVKCFFTSYITATFQCQMYFSLTY